MEEEKEIIGFDIDGVVATSSGILDFLARKVQHYYVFLLFLNCLMETPLGAFLYQKRKANKVVIKEIKNLHDEGFYILFISAIFQHHQEKVEKWLKKNQVPFDGLILQKKEESLVSFKTRALMQTKNLVIYLDDDARLVKAININIAVPRAKAVHYSGQVLSFPPVT